MLVHGILRIVRDLESEVGNDIIASSDPEEINAIEQSAMIIHKESKK